MSLFTKWLGKESPGYQIDLIFNRDDKVITICEVRYLQSKVSTKVIAEFEKKLDLFPRSEKKTIQRVLISNHGAEEALKNRVYFDNIITLDDLMDPHYF